jgi:hypothetical protein
MTTLPYADSDGDQDIEDTVRLHLYACYTNAEDGLEFTREELEEIFATDAGLRAWVTDRAGINPDTLIAQTRTGTAIINACANAWVAKMQGLSDQETVRLQLAGLSKLLS